MAVPLFDTVTPLAPSRTTIMKRELADHLGVATLSFYPSKALPCFGDGGAIAIDDDAIARTARALAFHGSHDKQTFTYVGYNSRLDELQAAILRVLLPALDGWCDGRRAGADAYLAAGLAEHVTVPVVPEQAIPAWHLYAPISPVFGVEQAEEVVAAIARATA